MAFSITTGSVNESKFKPLKPDTIRLTAIMFLQRLIRIIRMSSSTATSTATSSATTSTRVVDILPDKPIAFERSLDTLVIDAVAPSSSSSLLSEACALLNRDELVAFPTETVYGLGANALSEKAVAKIFIAKGRPSDNPLIVHVSNEAMLSRVARVDDAQLRSGGIVRRLIDRFWPGPLTILLPKADAVANNVTAGQDKVGVRMPANEIARRLIEQSNCPLAAPSANLSGKPSPTKASHVLDDMRGRVACVIDGGECQHGVESTVLDALAPTPLILRPGSVTLHQLREILPNVEIFDKTKHGTIHIDAPATPGLKYRHYAPNAPMTLLLPSHNQSRVSNQRLFGAVEATLTRLSNNASSSRNDDDNRPLLGVAYVSLSSSPSASSSVVEDAALRREKIRKLSENANVYLFDLGCDSSEIAHNFYNALRTLDEKKCSEIIVEGIADDNDGHAVMNRMKKAAFTIES